MAAVMKSSIGTQRVLGSLADTSGEMLGSGEIVFTRNVNEYKPLIKWDFYVSNRGIFP